MVEQRYVSALQAIMRAVHKALLSGIEITDDLKQDAKVKPGDIDAKLKQVLAQIPGKVGPKFDVMSKAVAFKNKDKLKSKLGISGLDLGVTPEIQAARNANIKLVEDAARTYAKQVREIFDDPNTHNLRVEELRDMLKKRASVSESKAELIARDQVLKLNGRITQIRQQMAGVRQYVWSTSRDERVRPEHAALEGQTFDWAAAPPPGHPGQDFQCRCVALPIIPGDEVVI